MPINFDLMPNVYGKILLCYRWHILPKKVQFCFCQSGLGVNKFKLEPYYYLDVNTGKGWFISRHHYPRLHTFQNFNRKPEVLAHIFLFVHFEISFCPIDLMKQPEVLPNFSGSVLPFAFHLFSLSDSTC